MASCALIWCQPATEGLDLPEVSLCPFSIADKGRIPAVPSAPDSERSPAARHGMAGALLYATPPDSMQSHLRNGNGRPGSSSKTYNETHGINPLSARQAGPQLDSSPLLSSAAGSNDGHPEVVDDWALYRGCAPRTPYRKCNPRARRTKNESRRPRILELKRAGQPGVDRNPRKLRQKLGGRH